MYTYIFNELEYDGKLDISQYNIKYIPIKSNNIKNISFISPYRNVLPELENDTYHIDNIEYKIPTGYYDDKDLYVLFNNITDKFKIVKKNNSYFLECVTQSKITLDNNTGIMLGLVNGYEKYFNKGEEILININTDFSSASMIMNDIQFPLFRYGKKCLFYYINKLSVDLPLEINFSVYFPAIDKTIKMNYLKKSIVTFS